MGLLDDLVNTLNDPSRITELLGNNPQIMEAAKAFLSDDSSVGPSGGLNDVLSQLQSSGLGDAVASWLGSGANQSVSADEVAGAINTNDLSQFAEKAGIDLSQAAGVLAGMLPQLVDKLSPQGSVPQGGGGLGELIGSFLGGRA